MGDTTAPDQYASEHAQRLLARWTTPIGLAVREFSPQVFPGAPPEAILAFTAGAAQLNEDTATNPDSGFDQHEIGMFQTPAGVKTGPAASGGSGDEWSSLARGRVVTNLLGRNAVTGPEAWKTAPRDQAAVGIAMLASNLATCAAAIPASIRPERSDLGFVGSQWAVALAFDAFSTGPGRAATRAGLYAPRLAAYPPYARFPAWVAFQAIDLENGQDPGPPGNHNNRAYDLLRVWQKLACGRELAKLTGGDVGWFDFHMSATSYLNAERVIVKASGGAPPSKATSIAASDDVPFAVKAMVAIALGAAAAWVFTEAME